MASQKFPDSGSLRPPILPVLQHYGFQAYYSVMVGRWQNIKCPFHEDRHASAAVNTDPEIQQFYCHAAHCGVAGDAYKIVMDREGCDFAEAKRIVQGITGHSGDGVSESPVRQRSLLPSWTRDRRRRDRAVPRRRSYS